MTDLAQIAFGDHAGHKGAIGVKAQFVVDHVQTTRHTRSVKHRTRLSRIHRGGFFAQNMGTDGKGRKGHGRVQMRWGGDADQIGAVFLQHGLPVVISGNTFRCCGLGRGQPARGEGHDPGFREVLEGGKISVAGETGPNDAGADHEQGSISGSP